LLPPDVIYIFMLKCTKFNFGWGSAPDSAGGPCTAPPGSLAGFKGLPRERRWEQRARNGRGEWAIREMK